MPHDAAKSSRIRRRRPDDRFENAGVVTGGEVQGRADGAVTGRGVRCHLQNVSFDDTMHPVIVSLKGKLAQAVVAGKAVKGLPASLLAAAERKMQAVNNAHALSDLRSPPGNRLEALRGNRSRPTFDSDQRPVAHLLCLDRGGRRGCGDSRLSLGVRT